MDCDSKFPTPLDHTIRPLHGRTSGPTRRSTRGQWTADEDEILSKAVHRFNGKNWKKIAEYFRDRTDVQCLHRWQKVLNPELVKGPWSKEEDEIIVEMVHKYGPKKWSTIARYLPGRIGKQCRERWHNHLNPTINKEAWTHQEELALIRAHQIYGNRWAELTKFLPGRGDNAIKNHWNSSVKKKLESYLASGLLDQFPPLPLAVNQNQSIHVGEAEEISESSQDSTVVGYSKSADDLAHVPRKEEFQLTEESYIGNEPSSPASCSKQYYTPHKDASFPIPDLTCEVGCSSNFLVHNPVHDMESSASMNGQYNSHELPNISSLELEHRTCANESQTAEDPTFQTSVGFAHDAKENMVTAAKPDRMLISDEECCRILFPEAMNNGYFSSVNITKGSTMDGLVVCSGSNSLFFRPPNSLPFETGKSSTSHFQCPSGSAGLETSCSQPLPSQLLDGETAHIYGGPTNFLYTNDYTNGLSGDAANDTGLQDQTYDIKEEPLSLSGDAANDTGLQEQTYDIKEEPLKLVPVSTLGSGSETMQTCSLVDENPNALTDEHDGGSLCYEPPRFPRSDVPFFSCDLIQSGSDMQQEYSPLGIRQLMMSSMNCISPLRLWDSPSPYSSPEAVLKSAAKTFMGTPSILRKRSRDLLSPFSDIRVDKKLEVDVASRLSKEFSRLDVMFDDSGSDKESPVYLSSNLKRNSGDSLDDKENMDPALGTGKEYHKNHFAASNIRNSGEDFKGKNCQDSNHGILRSDGKTDGDPDTSTQTRLHQRGILVDRDWSATLTGRISDKQFASGNCEKHLRQENVGTDAKTSSNHYSSARAARQHCGVLCEHNIDDLPIVSLDQVAVKTDKGSSAAHAHTPRNQYNRSLGSITGRVILSESSSGYPCLVVCSPSSCRKNSESHQSAMLLSVPDNNGNAGFENFNMKGETPLNRSINSPSAWKSPWFMNSFLSGPGIDTDKTIEDIGYLMSPGDRSYDSIGLMKQLCEHTAAAYADALEVLWDDPTRAVKDCECSNSENLGLENYTPCDETENRSHMASPVLKECRVLDFSECKTPTTK